MPPCSEEVANEPRQNRPNGVQWISRNCRYTPMNIAVDIGNTRLKCGIFLPNGEITVHSLPIPPQREQFNNITATCPTPVTWWFAPTGRFSWQVLQAEILEIRPMDQFEVLTRHRIPLKIDVDFPEKVGIDRLLAAFSAAQQFGDVPMLVVDAGTAITVDVVQDQTFCGGAILPGLIALSETYPQISEKLPLVSISGLPDAYDSSMEPPVYPGKNTKEAIQSGLYWGTIGAIRQFYEMCRFQKQDARLILTGGDAEYLLSGLSQVIPVQQITYSGVLVLEGIKRCFGGNANAIQSMATRGRERDWR